MPKQNRGGSRRSATGRPSFQRTLESMWIFSNTAASKMDPGVRRDDGRIPQAQSMIGQRGPHANDREIPQRMDAKLPRLALAWRMALASATQGWSKGNRDDDPGVHGR